MGAGNYAIEIYSNGSTNPLQAITLQGTVADDSVFVLRHSNATDKTILAAADQSAYDLNRYNGDDALVLRHNSVVIDAIG